MSLEKQIEDDFDTMMQYMSDNKLYNSMVKSLEMVKSTHPRYDYWFKIWEVVVIKELLTRKQRLKT